MSAPLPASAELIALAATARPDWPDGSVREALARAHASGMAWGQVLVEMGRLLADPDGTPSELAHAAPQSWRQRPEPHGAEIAHRGAAAARAALRQPTDQEGPTP